MEAAKKTYHMACKEEKLAAAREANGKTEASVTPDQQKKLHEKVDKCKVDTQKVRNQLEEKSDEIEMYLFCVKMGGKKKVERGKSRQREESIFFSGRLLMVQI